MRELIGLIAAISALGALNTAEAQVTARVFKVTGQVIEVGPAEERMGLRGVEVVLRGADGQEIGEGGITRPTGFFEITLDAASAKRAKGGTIAYRATEYVADPEVRPTSDLDKPQETVTMIKSNMPVAYYTTTVGHIASLPPGPERTALLNTIANLPQRDRAVVSKEIETRNDRSFAAEFRRAEEGAMANQKFRSQFQMPYVVARPNPAKPGEILLQGSVDSRAELDALKAFKAAVPNTTFDVRVVPRTAAVKK